MSIPLLFCFFIGSVSAYSDKDCRQDSHQNWMCDYMKVHDRNYSGHAEMKLRKSKLMSVKAHTQHKVQFGLTSRSDRFQHEIKSNQPMKWEHHKKMWRPPTHHHVHLGQSTLPPIDWRNNNGVSYVTSVKDQGSCGDCFAFASATILEYWSKKHGHPKSLSAQNIMDCTSGKQRPDVGCEGGLMEYVFEYAKKHPITLDSDFPYKEAQQTCPTRKLTSHVRVNKFKVLVRSSNAKAESEFEAILHNFGPISVGVDSTSMEHYKGGIFQASHCTTNIDHAVAIVGYTDDAWIIKNSWGPQWGENGYLRLERGKNACGVAEYAVYIQDATPVHVKLSTKWQKKS